jgi:hypothetical protein
MLHEVIIYVLTHHLKTSRAFYPYSFEKPKSGRTGASRNGSMENLKTFFPKAMIQARILASSALEKGRFLVGSYMLQVEIYYVLTYHLKASKGGGVPDHLLAKNGENSMTGCQS